MTDFAQAESSGTPIPAADLNNSLVQADANGLPVLGNGQALPRLATLTAEGKNAATPTVSIEHGDVDNILTTGLYALAADAVNRPPTTAIGQVTDSTGFSQDLPSADWFHLQVIAHDNGTDVIQIATDYNNVATYQRILSNNALLSGFRDWKRMDAAAPSAAAVPSYSNVPLVLPAGIVGTPFYRQIDAQTFVFGGLISRIGGPAVPALLFTAPSLPLADFSGIELRCNAQTRDGVRVNAIIRHISNDQWDIDAEPAGLAISSVWLDGITFSIR